MATERTSWAAPRVTGKRYRIARKGNMSMTAFIRKTLTRAERFETISPVARKPPRNPKKLEKVPRARDMEMSAAAPAKKEVMSMFFRGISEILLQRTAKTW
jgi:hypothetical protein